MSNDKQIRDAMHKRCELCSGGERCNITSCHLYRKSGNLLRKAHARCRDCLGNDNFETFRFVDCTQCPLLPWRPGPKFGKPSGSRIIFFDPLRELD